MCLPPSFLFRKKLPVQWSLYSLHNSVLPLSIQNRLANGYPPYPTFTLPFSFLSYAAALNLACKVSTKNGIIFGENIVNVLQNIEEADGANDDENLCCSR